MAEPNGPDPIYLDHNATTPVDPRVLDAMWPYFTEIYGNPSSVEHIHGARAQAAITSARSQIATAIGARDNEIVFTGSCTEANNIAILGAARARPERRHLITSAIEHPAVLEPMKVLESEGFEVTHLPVDENGQVAISAVEAALQPDTGLVSIMGANNEVGTLNPIAEIGALCEAHDVIFHADLAQVIAHRPVDVVAEHIHLASISGHKAYGPKGTGVLYARSRGPRVRLEPIVFGGGQERGLRSGTLNTPLIVGLAEALMLARRESAGESKRLNRLSSRLLERVLAQLEGVALNGHPDERLPGHLSLSIDGVEPLALMQRLKDVASFSASSACATDTVETSHVLLAMFGDTARARQAFRISPGRFTTESQMDVFTEALIDEVHALRRFAA